MRAANLDSGDWVDGFLFIANRPILDFLNTRPTLAQGSIELLPDFHALERWLIASEMVQSAKTKSMLRGWRNSSEAARFLKELIAFREQLRETVLLMESGSAPSDGFIQQVNVGLLKYPPLSTLRKREGRIYREPRFELKTPSHLWALFYDAAAGLLSEPETARLRKCEACVAHFFDISRKGSRRWCSMNICGNKIKVAAYQRKMRNRV